MDYITAIGKGFPGVECHVIGDATIYENIVWDGGIPLPSKTTLDEWIAANSQNSSRILTKYQFRKLFTFNERVIIDNAPTNTTLPEQIRAAVKTLLVDLQLLEEVDLDNADLINGVNLLEQMGLIAAGRAAEILTGIAPQ